MAAHLGRQIATGSRMVRQLMPSLTTTPSQEAPQTPATLKRKVSDLPETIEGCDAKVAKIDAEVKEILQHKRALTLRRIEITSRKDALGKRKELKPTTLRRANSK